MVSDLRSKNIEDHIVGLKEMITPSMIRMGFNTAGSCIKKIFYYLFNKVKGQGFLVALTCVLNNDNAWIIDSEASRHMIRKSKQPHTLSKESSSHIMELGDNKSY